MGRLGYQKRFNPQIEWMLSVAILIDCLKLVPQLLCNRTIQCSKILKLNINTKGFLPVKNKKRSYSTWPKISFQYNFIWRLYVFNCQLTCISVSSITQLLCWVGMLGSCHRFNHPVRWLLLLQLTVLSRSAIVVKSKILVAFLCCHVAFWIFLWV